MKRFLIALMAMTMLAAQLPVIAQTHRSTPRATTKSAIKNDTSAVEVFSDTTGMSSVVDDSVQSTYSTYHVSIDQDDVDPQVFGLLDTMFDSIGGAMIFALIITVIVFVIAPLAILFLIFYFIYKYRKQKLQLAETAIKTGQPIPGETIRKSTITDEDTWSNGVKKMFIGMGLIACCWVLDVEVGCAAGWILFFYGLGLMVIAKTTTKKENKRDTPLELPEEKEEDQIKN